MIQCPELTPELKAEIELIGRMPCPGAGDYTETLKPSFPVKIGQTITIKVNRDGSQELVKQPINRRERRLAERNKFK